MEAAKIPSYILIRSGLYYVRISIPHELRSALGKNELKRSLNTKDRTEAARRAPAVIASFQRDLERAKRQCTPVHAAISEIPLEDARGFARARLDNMQSVPDRSRAAGRQFLAGGGGDRQRRLGENRRMLEFFEEIDGGDHWDYWRTALGRSHLQAFEQEHIVRIERGSQAHGLLSEFGAQAQIEHVRRAIHRDEQPFTAAPAPDVGGIFPARDQTVTLERLVKLYREDKEPGWRPSSSLSFKKVEELLIDWFGRDRSVHSIPRDEWRELFRLLPHVPASRTKIKAFKGLSLTRIIEAADAAAEPIQRLSQKSCTDYVIHVQSLLNWASREELLPQNPAKGLNAPATARAGTAKKPFTATQLQTLFAAPPYAPTPSELPEEGRYWLPLIALFTGMRSGEIAQLGTTDIEEVDGVLCIRLTDPKTLKTQGSVRDVPIHSELRRLGLHLLVRHRREAGEPLLFPDVRPNGKEDRSSEFSKVFRKMLNAVGLADPSLTLHSFRHTFAHALVAVQTPQAVAEALQGWGGRKPKNMFAHYGGRPPLRQLAEAVERVTYPGLNLQHLHRCTITTTATTTRPGRQFD